MAEATGIETHRTIPGGLADLVKQLLENGLAIVSDTTNESYKVKHYAGEFLAEDNLERLKADVSQFPHVMYDVEMIDVDDLDTTERMPEDIFNFIIFCAVSNDFSESLQWSSSYELAWDARRLFHGTKFAAVRDIHAEGYFTPQSIERELHVPGMSVHTLRVLAGIVHDVDGNLRDGAGYNFSLSSNSHYIPLT